MFVDRENEKRITNNNEGVGEHESFFLALRREWVWLVVWSQSARKQRTKDSDKQVDRGGCCLVGGGSKSADDNNRTGGWWLVVGWFRVDRMGKKSAEKLSAS